jgi:hypothetical protein
MILRTAAIVIVSMLLLALTACPSGSNSANNANREPAGQQTGTPTPGTTTPPATSSTPPGATNQANTPSGTSPTGSVTPSNSKFAPGTPLPAGWPTELTLAKGWHITESSPAAADGMLTFKARQDEGSSWVTGFDLADFYSKEFPGWAVAEADMMKFVRTDAMATIPLTNGNTHVNIELKSLDGTTEELTFTLTTTS